MKFGLTVGLNVTTLDGPAGTDVNTRQMLAGGVVAQADVLGPLSLQGQLLLEQKGAAVQEGSTPIRYGAAYLSLPLDLRLQGPSLGPVTPYGLVGGFGSLKLFERQRAGSRRVNLPLETNTSFFQRTDAGATGGIGGTIAVGGGRRLNLAVRYAHGLVNVARSIDDQPFDQAPFPNPAETRTWSIMLRLGL